MDNDLPALPPKMVYENKCVLSGFVARKPYQGVTKDGRKFTRAIIGQVRTIERTSGYHSEAPSSFIDWRPFCAFGKVGEELAKLEPGRGYRFYFCLTLDGNKNKDFSETGAIKGFHNNFRLVPPYFEPVRGADPISKHETALTRKENL